MPCWREHDSRPDRAAPLAAERLEGVLARDREVSGVDRGPVLRRIFASASDLAWEAPGGGLLFRPPRGPLGPRGTGRGRGPGHRAGARARVPLGAAPPPDPHRRTGRAERGCRASRARLPRRSAPSRGWSSARRGRPRTRPGKPRSSDRSSAKRLAPLADGRAGSEWTCHDRVHEDAPPRRSPSPRPSPWRRRRDGGAAGRPSEALLPRPGGGRDRGRRGPHAGRGGRARPAARGLHGERGRRAAGDRGLRGGAPTGALPPPAARPRRHGSPRCARPRTARRPARRPPRS